METSHRVLCSVLLTEEKRRQVDVDCIASIAARYVFCAHVIGTRQGRRVTAMEAIYPANECKRLRRLHSFAILCNYEFLFRLRDIPQDMLTEMGGA